MTTVYSGTYDNLRTRCDYTTSSNATSVTVSGTIYLQHKGAANTFPYFPPSGELSIKGDIFDTIVASTAEVSSVSKHTNWTTIKSKTFSESIAKDTTAVTYTFKVSVYCAMADNATKTFTVSVPALASYTITYYPNGGSGGPAKQTKYYGQSLTLAPAYEAPTRTNYSFYKWNTASDGTGTYYNPGATYSGNAALNLYAIWNPKIIYNANGGITYSVPADQTKTFNQSISLSSSTPIYSYNSIRTFYKWNTKSDGSGTYYDPGDTYTGNTALILYAIWNNVVSYNGNGGKIPYSSDVPSLSQGQRKIRDQNLTLLSDTPTRSGYVFSKWNTIADGTGTDYSPGGTYSSNSDMTLYALWLSLPAKPQITSMTAIRWNETTDEQDDTGTSAKVTAEWSIDTTSDYYGNTNTGTVTLLVTPQSGSSSHTITPISGTSGTSGTAVFMTSGLDTDMQYTCKVTVTDLNASSNRSVILTRAFFIMDFKAGGNGIGIGRAAPEQGLEVGYAVTFDDNVRMYENLTIDGVAKASTPAAGDNSTKIATTAFVKNAVDNVDAGTATPTANKTAKFDSDAKMNSTDMTTGSGSEIETFLASLNTGVSDYVQRSELIPEVIVPTFTVTTGQLVEAQIVKSGKVCHLVIGVKNSAAISAGSNIFVGTMESRYAPKQLSNGVGYYGSVCGVIQLLNTGALTVRCTGAQLAANGTIYCSLAYILE